MQIHKGKEITAYDLPTFILVTQKSPRVGGEQFNSRLLSAVQFEPIMYT